MILFSAETITDWDWLVTSVAERSLLHIFELWGDELRSWSIPAPRATMMISGGGALMFCP